MKFIMLSLSILVIVLNSNYAQVKYDNAESILILDEEEENFVISEIRKKFMLINDNYLKNYLSINKELTENSAEGGEIKAYYDDTVLRKVIAAYYGETGKKIIDYYFWDNAIFFIFVQEYQYNSPIYVTEDMPEAGLEAYDESKTEIIENRYYFTQNKLIRWLDNNKKKVDSNTPLFIEKQKELLKDVHFIKEKLIQ